MANHKRRRPKNRRAGCLYCKPWKGNGCKHSALRRQELRGREKEREQVKESASTSARVAR